MIYRIYNYHYNNDEYCTEIVRSKENFVFIHEGGTDVDGYKYYIYKLYKYGHLKIKYHKGEKYIQKQFYRK